MKPSDRRRSPPGGRTFFLRPRMRREQWGILPAPSASGLLRIAHLTDIHVQPELHADKGMAACLKHVRDLTDKPDVIFTGGDDVFDTFAQKEPRARALGIPTRTLKDERHPRRSVHRQPRCVGRRQVQEPGHRRRAPLRQGVRDGPAQDRQSLTAPSIRGLALHLPRLGLPERRGLPRQARRPAVRVARRRSRGGQARHTDHHRFAHPHLLRRRPRLRQATRPSPPRSISPQCTPTRPGSTPFL